MTDTSDRTQRQKLTLHDRLWTRDAQQRLYGGDHAVYQSALLEQYKIYVEMADRISQRRGLTNVFFLTLNTAIFTSISVFWEHKPNGEVWWLLLPLTVLLAQCGAWYSLLRSYRQLNTAKYEVIGAMEERLPASPYFRAEWMALGEGKDLKRYWPLSHIERWIPILFGVLYILGFVALVELSRGAATSMLK
jgi:hypothetical protein